jgi:hypothetical protein
LTGGLGAGNPWGAEKELSPGALFSLAFYSAFVFDSFNLGFVQDISSQKGAQEKKEPWQRKTFQGECPARVFENQQHNNA